jgi:hypothetical protein
MSNTVEKTVAAYVQLNDRQALEDLRTYRQRLTVHLKARTGLDFSLTRQIDAEIARDRSRARQAKPCSQRMSTTEKRSAGADCIGSGTRARLADETVNNEWRRVERSCASGYSVL